MQWNLILAFLGEIGVVLSTLHIKQCTIHMWRRQGSHCGSSIRCLNGGRSCACIWMYNNVPNHWFFYLVWVYTFELGLPSFARLCPQNHRHKAIRPKPYAQNHMPQTICPKPYAQKHMPKTIHPKPNHTPKAIPYAQSHIPKTIPRKPYA